jgi:hypothetical protein
MFDIFNNLEVQKNPLLAAEFIKIVPAFDLVKHILQATDQDQFERVINNKIIQNAILDSDRDDLKLVLATYGNVLELWDSKDFLKLYEKGTGFKAALFSNSNIDWYEFDDADKVEILHKSLLADFEDETNKNLIFTIVTNPRMDRQVIANAMLGKHGFEALPVTNRLMIGAKAIKVVPIQAEYWPGKDSSDSHEIYFSEVNKAFLPMIRDAKATLDEVSFSRYLKFLYWQLPFSNIDIRPEHWLSETEVASLKIEYTNRRKFMDNEDKIHKIALAKVFDFFADWYQEDEGYPQARQQISRVGVPILAITYLLRNYWLQNDVKEIVSDLLKSQSLILRAAGYAAIFDNITVESESGEVANFFKQYPDNSLDKWIGITNTPAFWLCDRYGSNGKVIAAQIETSGYAEKINTAKNDNYKYLFLNSFIENLELHNSMTKIDLLDLSSKVQDSFGSAFTIAETKLPLKKPEKSFLRKLLD